MDEAHPSKLHRQHSSRPSTSQADNYGRVRGRAPLRQHPPVSYPAESAAGSSEGAGCAGSSSGQGVNKLWSNVRRSMSHGGAGKKTRARMTANGMYSTPVESLPASPSTFTFHDAQSTSPTIEQIAMGLHISRTPHLGSSSKAFHTRTRQPDTPEISRSATTPSRPTRPLHARRGSAPAITLPPPPARSSMKKQPPASKPSSLNSDTLIPSDSNASLSTLTSTAPSTPRSNRSASTSRSLNMSFSKLQLGMRLLLPTRKNSAPASTTFSDDDSASSELTPRKVVRFSVTSGQSTGDV